MIYSCGSGSCRGQARFDGAASAAAAFAQEKSLKDGAVVTIQGEGKYHISVIEEPKYHARKMIKGERV